MTSKPLSDAWHEGDPYERYIGRWSRQVAPRFLAWLGMEGGRRWLDVGCGTGALASAIVESCDPATVIGVDPSEGFLATARRQLRERASFLVGHASDIPLPDSTVDVIVSGLALNFAPDPHAALREMTRVLTDDGTIAAYVWDYAEKMELIRFFWDAAVELDPRAAELDEARRFPLCRSDALVELFRSSGLARVEALAIDVPTRFVDFADLWSPFLGGQGPAPAYAMSLSESARDRLRDHLRVRVAPNEDGSVELIARAWAVRGTPQAP